MATVMAAAIVPCPGRARVPLSIGKQPGRASYAGSPCLFRLAVPTIQFRTRLLKAQALSFSGNVSQRGLRTRGLSVTRNAGRISMGYDAGLGVLGNKAGMAMVFDEEGNAIPVTVIAFHEGNVVTQLKTHENDGYTAVQLGYRRVRESKLTKPELGHLGKSGCVPVRHLAEFRLPTVPENVAIGDVVDLYSMFKPGDKVDIRGKSIGKGFQGTVKRHNFSRGLMTHGSKSHRQPGTIGPGTSPGRVFPGKKMAGQMGNKNVTSRMLEVVSVDQELRCMLVKGAVPGKPGNLLRITPSKVVGKNIPPWV